MRSGERTQRREAEPEKKPHNPDYCDRELDLQDIRKKLSGCENVKPLSGFFVPFSIEFLESMRGETSAAKIGLEGLITGSCFVSEVQAIKLRLTSEI